MTITTNAIAAIALAGITTLAGGAAHADAVKRERNPVQTVSYPITFRQAGEVQTGWVYYRFFTRVRMDEYGSAPRGRKIVDDRSCRWLVTSHAYREVCFLTVLNTRSCQSTLSYELPYNLVGAHTKGNLLEYSPCEELELKVLDAKREVSERMMTNRSEVLAADLVEMRRLLPQAKVEVHYDRGRLVYPKPKGDAVVDFSDLPNMTHVPRRDTLPRAPRTAPKRVGAKTGGAADRLTVVDTARALLAD